MTDQNAPLVKKQTASAPRQQPRGSNQSGLRAHNERLVLTLLRKHGPLAKADLARLTGLSAQAMSVIMRKLEAECLLVRMKPVRGKVGQPSVPFGLASDGAFFFGLKIGRRSLDMVLTNFVGDVTNRCSFEKRSATPDDVTSFVQMAVSEMTEALPHAHRERIAGLGVAMPFRIWDWDDESGGSDITLWQDFDVADTLKQTLKMPVYSLNDASAASGAELVFGDQDRPADFLYIFIGSFVGGGLVLNNAVVTGPTGNAAALGSIPVRVANGARAQLATAASLSRLESLASEMGLQKPALWHSPRDWKLPSTLTREWVAQTADALAQAVILSGCMIDVERVIIDGWLPEDLRADLVPQTQDALSRHRLPGIVPPDIHQGSIGSDARALGAASLPLSHRFLLNRNEFPKG